MPSPLGATIDALTPVMQRGDLAGFQRLFNRLDGHGLSPEELTAAVGELAPILARRPEGVFARLARVAGAYVELGASPRRWLDALACRNGRLAPSRSPGSTPLTG